MFFSRSGSRIFLLTLLGICSLAAWSCGGGKSCGVLEKVFNEPSCKSLALEGHRSFTGTYAACGAPGSRTAAISCPSTAGTQGQCGSGSTGMAVVSILLPNGQSAYPTCNDAITAYLSNSLTAAVGVWTSTTGDGSTQVSCSSGSCTLTTQTCYAGWDSSVPGPTAAAANLPIATTYQYCTYIDTGPLGLTPIASGGSASLSWSGGLPTIVTGGVSMIFDSATNWVDAF